MATKLLLFGFQIILKKEREKYEGAKKLLVALLFIGFSFCESRASAFC